MSCCCGMAGHHFSTHSNVEYWIPHAPISGSNSNSLRTWIGWIWLDVLMSCFFSTVPVSIGNASPQQPPKKLPAAPARSARRAVWVLGSACSWGLPHTGFQFLLKKGVSDISTKSMCVWWCVQGNLCACMETLHLGMLPTSAYDSLSLSLKSTHICT